MTREKMTRILALIPPAMVSEIDAYQKRHGISTQAEAMRRLLRAALDQDKPKKRSSLSPDEAAALVVLEKLRKRLGDADAIETMKRVWHAMISFTEGDVPPPPTPQAAPATPSSDQDKPKEQPSPTQDKPQGIIGRVLGGSKITRRK
jgi:hypothetical protein